MFLVDVKSVLVCAKSVLVVLFESVLKPGGTRFLVGFGFGRCFAKGYFCRRTFLISPAEAHESSRMRPLRFRFLGRSTRFPQVSDGPVQGGEKMLLKALVCKLWEMFDVFATSFGIINFDFLVMS